MPTVADLLFRKLEDPDMELALALAASCYGVDDPKNESFGLTPEGPPAAGGEGWGIFMRGSIACVGWIVPAREGMAEITGAAIPRGQWFKGFLVWMADEWSRRGMAGADGELIVRADGGGWGLAEALTDAGFWGPDPEDEGFPRGEWRRIKLSGAEPALQE